MGRRVVVTGLGFVSSIGNSRAEVADSLRTLRHGLAPYPAFADDRCPVKLTGAVRGFDTTSFDPEDWTFPSEYAVKRDILRGLAPHGLYGYCSVRQALDDAGLDAATVSNPETGMFTASSGSASMLHHHLGRMMSHGVMRCSPMGIVSSIAGTLSFNLVAAYKIHGASTGFVSACASSGHALGYARDEIALGRQDRMIVVGAEDGNLESVLPFAGMRALSPASDPEVASCPFDTRRSGFVATGGAVTLILEDEETAKKRGAKIYAEFLGWGQASDGYSPAISHPEGAGLAEAMRRSLKATGLAPSGIDYINAHATSTPIGDKSELKAIKTVFGAGTTPTVSSTKGLTGHGLSMASALEAAICCLALKEQFVPGNAHLKSPDADAEGVKLPVKTESRAIKTALSNSSGFGGANVSLIFGAV
jgi:3-oxoacyl-[acyl-carrier-protein] synthase-1